MLLQDPGGGFPVKEVATILFSAVTALITIYNWQASRRRVKLKDDLEILRRYREEFAEDLSVSRSVAEDPSYKALRAKVRRRMERAYVLRRTDKSDILTGVANLAFAAAALTVPDQVLPAPFLLRAGVAAIFSAVALYFVYIGLKDRGRPHDFTDAGETEGTRRAPDDRGPWTTGR